VAILEQEFQSADIFFLPVHNTPYSAFLDAMKYELPVVTIDSWANGEVVENGKTGLLARNQREYHIMLKTSFLLSVQLNLKGNQNSWPPCSTKTCRQNEHPHWNKELRRQMGIAGRFEVEEGKFSLKSRDKTLKRILMRLSTDAVYSIFHS